MVVIYYLQYHCSYTFKYQLLGVITGRLLFHTSPACDCENVMLDRMHRWSEPAGPLCSWSSLPHPWVPKWCWTAFPIILNHWTCWLRMMLAVVQKHLTTQNWGILYAECVFYHLAAASVFFLILSLLIYLRSQQARVPVLPKGIPKVLTWANLFVKVCLKREALKIDFSLIRD